MAKRIKKDQSKAVLYIRVSSDKQAISGLGLADQETRCRAYCELMGLEVVETFRDEGVSAGKPLGTRPAGQALLGALKRTGAGSVVTLKLDRLFRSALDALANVETWEKAGVALHMIDFGGSTINTSTPAGKMFLTLMAGFAEFERGLISERTKAGLSVKKARGERVGRIPFGQRLGADGVTLEDCPAEQRTIDHMVDLHDAGFTVREIPAAMAWDGYTNRDGKPWTKSAVHRILSR